MRILFVELPFTLTNYALGFIVGWMGNEQIFLQVLTGLRTSIITNFELRDTVSMMRDQAAPLLTKLYALIVVQQDARQIAEAASATQEMVTDLLQSGAEITKECAAPVTGAAQVSRPLPIGP
jgi:hypothetical protein